MNLNLFSIFDPSTSFFFSLNWFSMFMFFYFFISLYWIMNSRYSYMLKFISFMLMKEFGNNLCKENYKSFFFFLGLFWFLFLNNFLGLFPYIFVSTSHFSVSLGMTLVFWFIFMMFGWVNKMNKMFFNLVPMGSPIYLSFFLVLIESLSNIIRPITLSIRLCANMIAGHIMLMLVSSMMNFNFLVFYFGFMVVVLLMVLEMVVSFIQSYIFVTLLMLYFNEI